MVKYPVFPTQKNTILPTANFVFHRTIGYDLSENYVETLVKRAKRENFYPFMEENGNCMKIFTLFLLKKRDSKIAPFSLQFLSPKKIQGAHTP